MSKAPFHCVEYTERPSRGSPDPIVEIEVVVKGKIHKLPSYVDTGCDDALGLSKKTADRIGLDESVRDTDEIQEVALADGTVRGAHIYRLQLKIGGRTLQKIVSVVDPDIVLEGLPPSSVADEPLVGRGLIDDYNVTFEGKSNPRRITFVD